MILVVRDDRRNVRASATACVGGKQAFLSPWLWGGRDILSLALRDGDLFPEIKR